MQLLALTRALARLEPIEAVASGSGHTRICGLLNAAKPAVAAALAQRLKPMVLITAYPQEAQNLAHEITCFSDLDVAYFPAIEALPYERVQMDRSVVAQREAVVSDLRAGKADVVVVPARALLQPLRDGTLSKPPAVLRVGDTVTLDELLKDWVQRGYTAASRVEDLGSFARRGGVIDVFPTGMKHPVRLEMFGNEIESLRRFDAGTQRSLGAIESVAIPEIAALDDASRRHALERLMELDTSTLNAEAETLWLDDLGRLESGAPMEEVSSFAPYHSSPMISLLDSLPKDSVILIDNDAGVRQAMNDLWEQATEVQRGLEESGNLPRGLMPTLLEPGNTTKRLERFRRIEWVAGSGSGDDCLDWTGLFAPARLYGGRLRTFIHDMERGSAKTVVLTTLQHQRIAELLAESELGVREVPQLEADVLPGISLIPISIAEGWSVPQSDLTLLSDHELFGRAKSRPIMRQRRKAREAFFAQFSPGDYVVHLEHGIGRFDGVTRMAIEGVEREYGLVQYAGTDRVYVPTDQLERLTRYIGVGDSAPQLNRLGGGEWQRARQRARQAAADIAKELIDVYARRMARAAHSFAPDTLWQHEIESSFPFPETDDQLQAVDEVKSDMEASRPMDRLVCADVGYGKTEVAVRAAFKAIMDAKQVAVLVPTTILAQQHFETFSDRFSGFPVRVETLSRFRSAAEQREILKRLGAGQIDVVIGTHRLLSKDVKFNDLGLLIVDEEQRFGVRHKEQLKKLRESIDVLTLTATPIPRTLHMGLVGIREISVIETPPEGRLPIRTYLQPFEDRLIRESVLREMDRDGQVFLVHNKVASIEAMAERVRALVPEARVLVAHGQMDDALLERVMLLFAHHEADVLVCSTIIENGVDMPNVNTIVVTNAHRLGLTQLYQLRGRVGRSANQAYAYLLYPRDVRLSHDAARRMEAVFEAQELGEGMNIAMRDLEIRGVGNLLGAEQSGNASAIGFDLYTRMIGEAVERLRGITVNEPAPVTIDLPLTMLLPAEYVGDESERLTLYRRLAAIRTFEELESFTAEIVDRFGAPPPPAQNLLTSVRIKLSARAARVTSVTLNREHLIFRMEPTGLYDRVSLYRKFGMEARVSTNVLRIPVHLVGNDWIETVKEILQDMIRLRESIGRPQAVEA